MDLELTADQQSLRDAVRDVLDRESPVALARRAYDDAGDARGADLWARLVELGWSSITVPESLGGLGLTAVEVAIVAEELGAHLTPSPFLATVSQFVPVLLELGTAEQQARWLGRIARGEATAAVAANDRLGSPLLAAVDATVTARPDGGGYVLDGTVRYVMDGASADVVAVAAALDGEVGVFVVERGELVVSPLPTVDATMPIADVQLDAVAVPADRFLGGHGTGTDGGRGLRRAQEQAWVTLALATVGTSHAGFEGNLAYAKAREQFGVPIGSFQVVKHLLADLLLAVERARAVGYFAAAAIAEDDPRRSFAASAAKAASGDCQSLCVQHGIQLYGGIGFTWDHDMHLHVRRAKAGEALLGDARFHRAEVARLLEL